MPINATAHSRPNQPPRPIAPRQVSNDGPGWTYSRDVSGLEPGQLEGGLAGGAGALALLAELSPLGLAAVPAAPAVAVVMGTVVVGAAIGARLGGMLGRALGVPSRTQ